MKSKLNSILLYSLLLLLSIITACKNKQEEHNHVVEHNHSENDTLVQIISPNKQVLSRQSTVKLSLPEKTSTLKAQGYIDIDRTRNKSVSTRFGGRIEKLFVKYDLQFVKKGDKILELYSPELNTFQEEHLFLLKSKEEIILIEQSRQKLKLLGLTDNQISLLEKNETFAQIISLYSPSDGYVLFNSTAKGDAKDYGSQLTSMNMTEKSNTQKKFNSTNSQIREGIYVNKGETLFSVNDLKNVWAIVSVSSEFHSALTENSHVIVTSELFPDKPLSGKIALTEQTFEDNKQRFVRIRIDLPNLKGELKLNSLITAEVPLSTKESFQIPASAVFRTGLNSFVWVKTGTTQKGTGIFQLRSVTTGTTANGMTTVISGLSANAEVAEHAGYLADSETFLKDY